MQGCDAAEESILVIIVVKVLGGDPAIVGVTSSWQKSLRELKVIFNCRHPEEADVQVDAISVTVQDHTWVWEHKYLSIKVSFLLYILSLSSLEFSLGSEIRAGIAPETCNLDGERSRTPRRYIGEVIMLTDQVDKCKHLQSSLIRFDYMQQMQHPGLDQTIDCIFYGIFILLYGWDATIPP